MTKPSCFIAMPLTTTESDAARYGDDDHWTHVLEALFVPAVEAAGFIAVRPVAQGAVIIHANIVQQLQNADMVLCDTSGLNANVFFELGVRTSVNRPVTMVRDAHTSLPFDTGTMNTHTYDCKLEGWRLEEERLALKQHIDSSVATSDGKNPMWMQFGLQVEATPLVASGDPVEARDAKLDLLLQKVQLLESSIAAPPSSWVEHSMPPQGSVSTHVPVTGEARKTLPSNVLAFLDGVTPVVHDAPELVWSWFGGNEVVTSKPQLDALPLANRRIVRDMANDYRIALLETPF